MGLPAEKRRYTIQEYLDLEEKAVDRHEFHDGEILAMSGGTFGHSRIKMNFGSALNLILKGKSCQALGSDMRVRIPGLSRYLYPDISVVCGNPQFDPDDRKKTTILNPRLVIEVLSETTESYDRGSKFDLYREIPSLEEYILVSQHQPLIETFFRQPKGQWLFTACKGMESSATLRSLQITLPLAEIYTGIDLENPEAASQ